MRRSFHGVPPFTFKSKPLVPNLQTVQVTRANNRAISHSPAAQLFAKAT